MIYHQAMKIELKCRRCWKRFSHEAASNNMIYTKNFSYENLDQLKALPYFLDFYPFN